MFNNKNLCYFVYTLYKEKETHYLQVKVLITHYFKYQDKRLENSSRQYNVKLIFTKKSLLFMCVYICVWFI